MTNYRETILVYSLEHDKNTFITPHFQVKEFKCKDGCNYVFVNKNLINTLERVFIDLNAKVINITSGYRTESNSKKFGDIMYKNQLL